MNALILMIVAHALADYPLQGDFLAKAKNSTAPLPDVPWWIAMFMHAAIHAGFVYVITGSLLLGVCELVIHAIIDNAKCRGEIDFTQDQALHIVCKVWWYIWLVNIL